MNHNSRVRLIYIVAAVATIVVGLLVHLGGAALGPVLRDMLGDALWAAMIVWFPARWRRVRGWRCGVPWRTRCVRLWR